MSACRKCDGSGHFKVNGTVRGDCYECDGTGRVDDIAYVSTPASESKHPAVVAERKLKKDVFVPPTPELVERCLGEMHAALDGIEGELVEEKRELEPEVECFHHQFRGHYVAQCMVCGLFEHQALQPVENHVGRLAHSGGELVI